MALSRGKSIEINQLRRWYVDCVVLGLELLDEEVDRAWLPEGRIDPVVAITAATPAVVAFCVILIPIDDIEVFRMRSADRSAGGFGRFMPR
jgi:hypothetical protein